MLETYFFGDVVLVDGIAEVVLRFHQRRAGDDEKTGEIGRAESSKPFGDIRRWTRNSTFELAAKLRVARKRTRFAQPVDGILVRSARLPGPQIGESLNTHGRGHSMANAAVIRPVVLGIEQV